MIQDYKNAQKPKTVHRFDWRAKTPTWQEGMRLPTYVVILNLYSETEPCETDEQCRKIVKDLQIYHQRTLKFTDIAFNFLIGGNGIVYKGRGWTTNSERTVGKYKLYDGKCHEVCLIGDWREKEPPLVMLDTFKKLIAYGVRKGFVDPSYEIIERKEGVPTTFKPPDVVRSVATEPWTSKYDMPRVPVAVD